MLLTLLQVNAIITDTRRVSKRNLTPSSTQPAILLQNCTFLLFILLDDGTCIQHVLGVNIGPISQFRFRNNKSLRINLSLVSIHMNSKYRMICSKTFANYFHLSPFNTIVAYVNMNKRFVGAKAFGPALGELMQFLQLLLVFFKYNSTCYRIEGNVEDLYAFVIHQVFSDHDATFAEDCIVMNEK